MQQKDKFENLAKTSSLPLGFEVERADGIYFFDKQDNKYYDLIAGICVNNLGHNNPGIINAIKSQADKYLHVMAYGEFVEKPQIEYAELLCKYLPENLNSVYFVNSGSEAIEGALKLAKRITRRTGLISFKNSYYGGTHGALSIAGDDDIKRAFRPLLPDVISLNYNSISDLDYITDNTACVVVECIQGESGYIEAHKVFLKALRLRCTQKGVILILDEVQTAFGRTGSLFAFEQYDIKPDILVLAKALGGGMPLGAFISSKNYMSKLQTEPVLGHITTFGGHPICCAAGIAFFSQLIHSGLIKETIRKSELFRKLLKHEKIIEIRGKGLLLSVVFENDDLCNKILKNCLLNRLISDSFVFAGNCLRISPALTIDDNEIDEVCRIILNSINKSI